MSGAELSLCLSAVLSSSVSQLLIKSATATRGRARSLMLLACAAALLCASVLLVVLALRSLPLSQLMPFAAGAYVLVPLGSRVVFLERLTPRFWLGAILIICGIIWTYS